jgi:hypothetical protein
MSDTRAANEKHTRPGLYEIRIKGHLEKRWIDWFEGLTIMRDLGLPLVSIMPIEPQ